MLWFLTELGLILVIIIRVYTMRLIYKHSKIYLGKITSIKVRILGSYYTPTISYKDSDNSNEIIFTSKKGVPFKHVGDHISVRVISIGRFFHRDIVTKIDFMNALILILLIINSLVYFINITNNYFYIMLMIVAICLIESMRILILIKSR